jgi:hypothetical protein
MRNPFKKERPLGNFERQREMAKELDALLDRAGIKDKYEREERVFEPDWFADRNLPPLFTKARKEAERRRERTNRLMFRDGVRRIVFAIPDEALRKEIITCQRKLGALTFEAMQGDLRRGMRERNNAGYISGANIGALALVGAAIVFGVWSRVGAQWGAAATAFVIIVAVYDAVQRQFSMRRAVENATEEIQNLEADIDAHLEAEIFDQYEEDAGKEFKSVFEVPT